MKIVATPRYIRALGKFIKSRPDYYSLITRRLELLQESPFHPQLRLHKLSNRENEHAISIDQSIRIVFHRDKDTCYLLDISSHDEAY